MRKSRVRDRIAMILIAGFAFSGIDVHAQDPARRISRQQCQEEGGEVVGGIRPLECPKPERRVGNVFGAHCKCICCTPAGAAQRLHPAVRIIAASPLVETRDGRQSIWGITLTLSPRLSNTIQPANFSIQDDKHSREFRKLMDFRLSQRGAHLTIRFKPGLGGFGGSRSVTVTIRAGTPLASGTKTEKDVSTLVNMGR